MERREEQKKNEERKQKEEEEQRKLSSAFLPVMGALQVFGPTVLPTMEEIIIGQAIDHYKEGMKNMKGTGFEVAVRSFNKALHLKPFVIDFYRQRAAAFLQLCDFQSAIKDYKKIIALDPEDQKMVEHLAFVYYFYGQVLFDQHLFPDALEAFSKAAQIQPFIIAYQARSFACLAALGRHQECLSLVNKGIDLDSSNPDLYIMRARLHQLANRITECYYDVREALSLDPSHCEALKLLRGIEARASDFMMAAVQMELAGKLHVAAVRIALAIKTNPAVPVFHNIKGALHRKKHEFNEAIDDYLIAIDKSGNPCDPVFRDAHNQLILTYNDFAIECYNKGAYDDAVQLLNKAINAEKNQKGLYINRGDCFLRLGELLFALADYRQALDLDPKERSIYPRISFIYYHYGILMTQEKNGEEAINYFHHAIDYNPAIGQFYVCLASAASMERPPAEARFEILKAISLVGPNHKSIIPLTARLFPGKTHEQILSMPELHVAAQEVEAKIKSVDGAEADEALQESSSSTGSSEATKATRKFVNTEFARCEDDIKFFEELIEGRRVVNLTVKKLLQTRVPPGAKPPDGPAHDGGIQALPPAVPYERRAGGLPDILAHTGATSPTSVSSAISRGSTDWKTLIKKIRYRSVKKFTEV